MAVVNSQSDRLTVFQETSDGVSNVYPLRFALGYIKRSDIYVYRGEHGDYANQLPYTWVDDNNIEVVLAAGEEFWVRRIVNRDDLDYYFKTASLHPATIDKVHLQLLMLSQELMDGFGDRDGLGNIKNILDMRDYRIENLGAGRTGTNDAVNMAQFQAVSDQLDRIDDAVAQTESNVTESTLQADRAQQEADRAQQTADAVHITPLDALEWNDPLAQVQNQLKVSIEKQAEVPQAVANDYVLVSVNGELKKVQVKNLLPTGSAYDIRGSVILDAGLTTGTVTDTVDVAQYAVDVDTYTSPNAAVGHAFTVVNAVSNGITGEVRDWDVGDILMWTNSGWYAVDVAVMSWQGKIGDVTVELGDISSDVVHVGGDTAKALSVELMETVRKSHGITGGVDVPKWADDAGRPDTTGVTKAILGYNVSRKQYESWNPDTGKWGDVGGGGISAYIDKVDTDFTANAREAYLWQISGGSNHTATLAAGIADDEWFEISIPAFIDGQVADIDFNGEVLVGNDGEFTSLRLTSPMTIAFTRRNGKWYVIKATATGDYGSLEKRIAVVESYPTDPVSMESLLINGATVSSANELLGWWESPKHFHISGIIRSGSGFVDSAAYISLPKYNRLGEIQFRGVTPSIITNNSGAYTYIDPNENYLRTGNTASATWVMLDIVLIIED